MSGKFQTIDRDTAYLLPPSLQDWLRSVMALVVVAANADDAEEALQCEEIFEATPGTDPAASPGCNFFSCTLLD